MSNNNVQSPRASTNGPTRQRRLSRQESSTFLPLDRTRSSELSVGETVAVHEPAQQVYQKAVEEDVASLREVTQPWPPSVRYLILLCAFITSTSFGVTQVPILYVLRLMTCDIYYETHPDPSLDPHVQSRLAAILQSITSFTSTSLMQTTSIRLPDGVDRCAVPSIDSSTALNITLLGAATTIFGIINLFWTGILIKRIGLKTTLIFNVAVPALRLLVQNIGVEVWGKVGIIIVQCSQTLTVMGGPSGYVLVLNSYMTEVVDYEERTAGLGKVAGSMMFGNALGFLIGGLVADATNIKVPFRITLGLFICSAIYVAIFLPYIPPPEPKKDDDSLSDKPKKGAVGKFIAPLLVFTPRKFVRMDGVIQMEFGTFLLACGVFLGILATGYLPTLLQLFSTDVFGFGTRDNAWLIFMYSLLRGLFLTFIFPSIIKIGRKLTSSKQVVGSEIKGAGQSKVSERDPLLASTRDDSSSTSSKIPKKEDTFVFDLFYTRFSILLDGLLTLVCTLAREGWHMYIIAAILPFAAGTGSAAKGTVLQMVGSTASSAERVDALAGLSLVENMARLSTTFVFGVVFAAFASIGRNELTFTVNAAIAIFGFLVLLFARFPPEGSRRLDHVDEEAESSH